MIATTYVDTVHMLSVASNPLEFQRHFLTWAVEVEAHSAMLPGGEDIVAVVVIEDSRGLLQWVCGR